MWRVVGGDPGLRAITGEEPPGVNASPRTHTRTHTSTMRTREDRNPGFYGGYLGVFGVVWCGVDVVRCAFSFFLSVGTYIHEWTLCLSLIPNTFSSATSSSSFLFACFVYLVLPYNSA